MHKSIILLSCLLGSFYLCGKSLELINKQVLEDNKSKYLSGINESMLGVSLLSIGSCMIACGKMYLLN